MANNNSIIRIFRRVALVAFVWAGIMTSQLAAEAKDKVPFHASYSLNLEMVVNPPFATITSTGEALATHFGRSRTEALEETVNLATGQGLALHQFTLANGDIVLIHFTFLAVATSATLYEVDGIWEIAGGTGRFAGATGSGTYYGLVEFGTPTTAVGDFELTGSVSSVGSLR